MCVCVCVFAHARICISYLDIERVPFPPPYVIRAVVAIAEKDKKKGSRVRSGGRRGRRIPLHSPVPQVHLAHLRDDDDGGRKGVSCMRAARRAAYR